MKRLKVSREEYSKIFAENYEGKEIRIFLSYSSTEKTIAGNVKDLLEKYGLSIFLAHEDIKPTVDWQKEVIRNLEECDIFLPILTKGFRESDWTDQETGMAFALGEFIIPLKVEKNPYGFIRDLQACNFDSRDPEKSCLEIIQVIRDNPAFRESLTDCLLRPLEKALNFDAANDIIKELEKSKTFTKEQVDQIFRISLRNDQVRLCSEGQSFLKPMLKKYGLRIEPILREVYRRIKDEFGVPSWKS